MGGNDSRHSMVRETLIVCCACTSGCLRMTHQQGAKESGARLLAMSNPGPYSQGFLCLVSFLLLEIKQGAALCSRYTGGNTVCGYGIPPIAHTLSTYQAIGQSMVYIDMCCLHT